MRAVTPEERRLVAAHLNASEGSHVDSRSGIVKIDLQHEADIRDALRIEATGEPLARKLATALAAYSPEADA